MVELVKYSQHNDAELKKRSLCPVALSKIFLGRGTPADEETVAIRGAPVLAQWFMAREHRACGIMFDGLRNRNLLAPDPWTGEESAFDFALLPHSRGTLPIDMLPIFYHFESSSGNSFWLINYSAKGRISQVYLPSLNCAFFDIDEVAGRAAVVLLEETIHKVSYPATVNTIRKTIGIIDNLPNFGHQLTNHLSGLQRSITEGCVDGLDEIWLTGLEFFGPIEQLFPDVNVKIRRFSDRWSLASELNGRCALPLRLGSNIFTRPLHNRIVRQIAARSSFKASAQREPIIAITIRSDGRRCLNLPTAIELLVERLVLRYPKLGILLDGYVLPKSQLVASSSIGAIVLKGYDKKIREEMVIAADLANRLPAGVLVGNVIGQSMLESLNEIRHVDAYIAHIGTLQHKLGFFTDAVGVVHGPTHQLESIEGGPFQTEIGRPPYFLPVSAVANSPSDNTRGPGFYDYKIIDIDELVKLTSVALSLK